MLATLSPADVLRHFAREPTRAGDLDAPMRTRTNAEWLSALASETEAQSAALSDLRAYLLRAALYALVRRKSSLTHLAATDIDELAQDSVQEALSAILQHLGDFRGDSQFTTWAYTFAVNAALVAARRERWRRVPLDRVLDSPVFPADLGGTAATSPDPHRRTAQGEMLAAVRETIEAHLTTRQQQALKAVVFDGVPLDELARLWGSNRNALYKLLHDARKKLKAQLRKRGFDTREMLDAFGEDR